MRAIVTGQVGVDKGPYLAAVKKMAADRGIDLCVCNVGEMMYKEAPDVPKGRILNLPITRLNTLRRAVFKEILREADRHEHILVNTHATFRWRHGLFAAFDFDHDDNLELAVGGVISFLGDYLQGGFGYNIPQDRAYWFFGLRLPVPTFTLPGAGGFSTRARPAVGSVHGVTGAALARAIAVRSVSAVNVIPAFSGATASTTRFSSVMSCRAIVVTSSALTVGT